MSFKGAGSKRLNRARLAVPSVSSPYAKLNCSFIFATHAHESGIDLSIKLRKESICISEMSYYSFSSVQRNKLHYLVKQQFLDSVLQHFTLKQVPPSLFLQLFLVLSYNSYPRFVQADSNN